MRAERSLMFWRQLAAMRAEPFAAVPDATLLDRYAADRDEAAFEELARRHGGMVWAVCRQLLPDPADAEDAFQAVFLAFVKSSGRVRHGNVGAWLHGTAVRGAMKVRRGAVRARHRDRATAKPEATAPPADWNELLTAVHEEVGRLPEALRTAFVVCDLEGVPQPDAATRLGWKPGTLTGRLSKARKRLLDALTKRGLAPAATLGLLGLSAATTSADVPLKLLVTVLNFPSAAPGTIPAALAALSLEIVPMTLSKVKLLALAAMLTCGLAAGTGTVLVPMADAQGPPAATKPADLAKPPDPPTPTLQDKLNFAVTKGLEVPAGEFVYKYLPRPKGSVPLGELSGLLHMEGFNGGWEFAGAVTARMTEKEFQTLSGTQTAASTDKLGDYEVFVFKKRATPAKQATATITDSKSGTTLTANSVTFGTPPKVVGTAPPAEKPTVTITVSSPEAFQVTEIGSNGVHHVTKYAAGERVNPHHTRFIPRPGDKVPSPVTPLPGVTRLETRLVPTPSPVTPTDEYASVCTTDFVITVNNGGKLQVTQYSVGDVVKPSDLQFVQEAGGKTVPVQLSQLAKVYGNIAPPTAPTAPTPTSGPPNWSWRSNIAPPTAPTAPTAPRLPSPMVVPPPTVAEPLVIELKAVSAEAVVALCKEVLPKSVKVLPVPQTNSVIVINATTDDVKTVEKLVKIIDKPGKSQPQAEYYPLEPVFPLSRQPDDAGGRLPPPRDLQPLPSPQLGPLPVELGNPLPTAEPPLSAPRIDPLLLQPVPSPKPAKKPKAKPPVDPHMSPERIHGGTL